jgi:hypothetical protein
VPGFAAPNTLRTGAIGDLGPETLSGKGRAGHPAIWARDLPMVAHLTDKGWGMREPLAAMWRALEETSARNLSAQQAKSFVRTAYAIADAISSRTLPPEEST